MNGELQQEKVRVELFAHLQALEYSLSQGRRVAITLTIDKSFVFTVYSEDAGRLFSTLITAETISNMENITDVLDVIKQDLIDRKLIYPTN